jgi:hypothetical protein
MKEHGRCGHPQYQRYRTDGDSSLPMQRTQGTGTPHFRMERSERPGNPPGSARSGAPSSLSMCSGCGDERARGHPPYHVEVRGAHLSKTAKEPALSDRRESKGGAAPIWEGERWASPHLTLLFHSFPPFESRKGWGTLRCGSVQFCLQEGWATRPTRARSSLRRLSGRERVGRCRYARGARRIMGEMHFQMEPSLRAINRTRRRNSSLRTE